ncbi:lectin-like domain-containing protein, partial [Streptococcus himalayensis]
MVGKNNKLMQAKRDGEKFTKYSLRKMKVRGAASVMIAAFFLLGGGASVVYAEEAVTDTAASSQVVSNSNPASSEQEGASETETTPAETPAPASLETPAPEAPAPAKSETPASEEAAKTPAPEAETPAKSETPAPEAETPAKSEASEETTPAESKPADSAKKASDKEKSGTVEVKEQPIHAATFRSAFRSVGSDRSTADNREAAQPILGPADYVDTARLEVTKKNLVSYFIVGGNAHGNDVEPVTLTEDTSGQVGSLGLFSKINMNEDFTLIGKLNLGDKYEGYRPNGRSGGDGVSFVFTTKNPGDVGLAGASIGIGGIPNSFGFKLDTWHNTGAPKPADKAQADPKFSGYENGAFGAFYNTNAAGVAITNRDDAKSLISQPTGELTDLRVDYNGASKVMTVTYGGQVFSKNIQAYLNASRTTTKQQPGQETLAFAIFASTGAGTNLQQFDLTSFNYSAGGSYIKVLYKDEKSGEIIQEKIFEGTTRDTLNLSDKLAVANYVKKGSNEETAVGYRSPNTIAYQSGIQTITYTYAKADKRKLQKLVDGDDTLKASSDYTTASKETQDVYNAAIAKGREVLADTAAEQPAIDASIQKINDAISALKASAKEAADAAAAEAAATAAVEAAEAASNAGKAKKTDVESDNIVNPSEKEAVDALNTTTNEKKTAASSLVDALKDGPVKTALKERLNNVVPSEVTVNDANNDGKDDAQAEAEAAATAAVEAAEAASNAGKAKKTDVESDNIVNPSEKEAVDAL